MQTALYNDVTHSEIIKRISSVYSTPERCSIFDPCCGDASAIKNLKDGFLLNNNDSIIKTYGIENNLQIAEIAKNNLYKLGRGSYQSARISHKAFSLLLLHPPSDYMENEKPVSMASERMMYIDNIKYLIPGGALIYIIPKHSLNKIMARMLSYRLTNIEIYDFPKEIENKFNKIIVLGILKEKYFYDDKAEKFIEKLSQLPLPPLPHFDKQRFILPMTDEPKIFRPSIIDPNDLIKDINQSSLWNTLERSLKVKNTSESLNPLIPLHQGHIALLLASGNLNGKISNHLVKGLITKDNIVTSDNRINEKRSMTYKDRYIINVKILEADGTIKTLS